MKNQLAKNNTFSHDEAIAMLQELLEASMDFHNERTKSHNHIAAQLDAAKQRCVQASAVLYRALTGKEQQ